MVTKLEKQFNAGRLMFWTSEFMLLIIEETASILAKHVEGGRKGYVCLLGVHGVIEAWRDRDLRTIFCGGHIGGS
jgi:hypothetical protein